MIAIVTYLFTAAIHPYLSIIQIYLLHYLWYAIYIIELGAYQVSFTVRYVAMCLSVCLPRGIISTQIHNNQLNKFYSFSVILAVDKMDA